MSQAGVSFRAKALALAAFVAVALAGCGGGGGGGSAPPPPSTDETPSPAPERTPRTVSWLSEGNFWTIAWSEIKIDRAFLGQATGDFDVGSYVAQLGAAQTVGGMQMYPLRLDGDVQKYTPLWTHLGANQYGDIYGLTAGSSTPVLLYSPELATWPYRGYYSVFEAGRQLGLDRAASMVLSNYTTSVSYFQPPVASVGFSTSSTYSGSGCEYFPGYGTICGSGPGGPTSGEMHFEYWHPTAGPIGMHYSYDYEDCLGFACTEKRRERRTEAWFFGDTSAGSSAYHTEPDGYAAANAMPVSTNLFTMFGQVHAGDAQSAGPTGAAAYDWYRFDVATAGTVDFYLFWSDDGIDFALDLYTAPDSIWGFLYQGSAQTFSSPDFKYARFISGTFQPGKFMLALRRPTASQFGTFYGIMSIRD